MHSERKMAALGRLPSACGKTAEGGHPTRGAPINAASQAPRCNSNYSHQIDWAMSKSRHQRQQAAKPPACPAANEIFDHLHQLVDRLLKDHFQCVAGIKSDQPATYTIPSGETGEYDFVLRASGPRTRGRPKVIYIDITRRATKDARILAITTDEALERRDMRFVIGPELPVFSFYQGFIDNHGLPAEPSVIPDVPQFIERLTASVKRIISHLQDWYESHAKTLLSLKERQDIVERLLDF